MTDAAQRGGDNRTLALICILLAIALASTQDAMMKWLSGAYPVQQVLLVRSLVAMPVLLPLAVSKLGWRNLLTPMWPRTFFRGFIMGTALLSFSLAIAAIPIADAITIYFTMPFFVVGLAPFLLKERPRIYRIIAMIAGFIGVLIAFKPGAGLFEPAALLALWSAFAYGLGQMIGRTLAGHVPARTVAVHQNFVYLLLALLLTLVFLFADSGAVSHKSLAFLTRSWSWPPFSDAVVMLGIGLVASMGMLMFTTAYSLAESNFVAPFEYTGLLWAVAYGLILFGDRVREEYALHTPIFIDLRHKLYEHLETLSALGGALHRRIVELA
ncbi:MAG: DMT family transporter, partial [Rhizobiales bacterium]|nr:DMT family transporter [Hyphomicrobiales bacterium]